MKLVKIDKKRLEKDLSTEEDLLELSAMEGVYVLRQFLAFLDKGEEAFIVESHEVSDHLRVYLKEHEIWLPVTVIDIIATS